MELTDNTEMVSQYSRLLLHEKERTAVQINKMLKKGFQILPKNRYQNVEEMLSDLKKLTDILNGTEERTGSLFLRGRSGRQACCGKSIFFRRLP